MNLVKRLWQEEHGQGLAEYTLVVLLVALGFWVAVKQADMGPYLEKSWARVVQCVATPFICSA
jgi:Flp pilus assembly pilin Flp